MERVLVAFGDSNTHGSPPWTGTPAPRHGPDVRWPGVLAATLGPSWRVHEEGLPGRTTVHPDPVEGGHLSGLAALPVVLGTHSPVDVLVIMLGTNDLKARFAAGPADIVRSLETLVHAGRGYCSSTGRPVPRILLVAPAPITEVGEGAEVFRGGAEKSRRLGPMLRTAAGRLGVEFLDAGEHVTTSAVDGIHLDPDAHRVLGEAVAGGGAIVERMFESLVAVVPPDAVDDLDGVLERLLAEAEDTPGWTLPLPAAPDGDEPPAYGSATPSGWAAVDLDTTTEDPTALSDAELIEAMIGFDRLASWAHARQAPLFAELARRRPTDRAPASVRWAGVASEYAADEIGVALHLSRGTASARLGLATRLLTVLPETHALWEAGQIDTPKARAVDDATWMLAPDLARAVQNRVLPRAPRQTLAQLKAALARAVIAVDPEGAEQRHRQVRRDRRVVITPEADGMASLWALLTATDAAGAFTWLTRLARGLGPDDPRSMDARRADLLAAVLNGRLVLRPDAATDDEASGATTSDTAATPAGSARPIQPVAPGKPLIQVVVPHSTLVGADDQPAELVGHGPIPAGLAREVAADAVWRRLVTDPLSGTLLDHGRTTYHPPAGLADHVRARDVYCRFPGCRRRAVDAELDHVVSWSDGGTTSEDNLAGCCGHHHRVKTYAGWRVDAHPDRSLTWTTPTGHRYSTRPHDYGPEPPVPVRDDPGLDPPPF